MEMNTRQGMRPVCCKCGGQDLALEASVYWTPGKGAEVGELCDKGHYCGTCDGETGLTWVPEVPAEAGMPSNAVKLRLTLDVSYDLQGVDTEAMQERLHEMVQHAVNNGLLTGDTPAEVDVWEAHVSEVPAR